MQTKHPETKRSTSACMYYRPVFLLWSFCVRYDRWWYFVYLILPIGMCRIHSGSWKDVSVKIYSSYVNYFLYYQIFRFKYNIAVFHKYKTFYYSFSLNIIKYIPNKKIDTMCIIKPFLVEYKLNSMYFFIYSYFCYILCNRNKKHDFWQ